uniref:Putative secreted protein n=1 Tax=Anopheles darlingi TaxID=43151 RepID=A0A2M4D847_ANODA
MVSLSLFLLLSFFLLPWSIELGGKNLSFPRGCVEQGTEHTHTFGLSPTGPVLLLQGRAAHRKDSDRAEAEELFLTLSLSPRFLVGPDQSLRSFVRSFVLMTITVGSERPGPGDRCSLLCRCPPTTTTGRKKRVFPKFSSRLVPAQPPGGPSRR